VSVKSAKVRASGLPCSTAVKANGFVFISATPTPARWCAATSKRSATEGAETLPRSGGHLVGQRRDGAHLRRQFRLLQRHQPVYAKYFSVNPPTRSFVPVASSPMEFDIEIDVCGGGVRHRHFVVFGWASAPFQPKERSFRIETKRGLLVARYAFQEKSLCKWCEACPDLLSTST
jgi:2-iminobutanoate/2-iminopropanoate deaminase